MQAGGQRFESVILHYSRGVAAGEVIDILEQERKTNGPRRRKGAAGIRSGKRRMVDALAPAGDEGRGKLRKSAGRRKRPMIRGYPNGATRRHKAGIPRTREANAGN